jgi:hypothetical protein
MRLDKVLVLLTAATFGIALIGCQREGSADRPAMQSSSAAKEGQAGAPAKEGSAGLTPGATGDQGSQASGQPGEKSTEGGQTNSGKPQG